MLRRGELARSVVDARPQRLGNGVVAHLPNRAHTTFGGKHAQETVLPKIVILGDDHEVVRCRVLPNHVIGSRGKPHVCHVFGIGKMSANAKTSRGERFWSNRSLFGTGL